MKRESSIARTFLTAAILGAVVFGFGDPVAASAGIQVATVSSFTWVYDDSATGAKASISIWRPQIPSGFYSLGDVAMSGHGTPPQTTLAVRGLAQGALSHPSGWSKVWDDSKSGGRHNVGFWKPKAPAGYICLGDMATRSHSEPPPTSAMVCVHSSLVVPGSADWVWDDRGSGARLSTSVWEASNIGAPHGLRSNTFVSQPTHSPAPQRLPMLNMDRVAGFLEARSADWPTLARTFAPYVRMHSKEQFFPSDVEYHFANTTLSADKRYLLAQLECDICTNQRFLYGKNPASTAVPMYAFVLQKPVPAGGADGVRPGAPVVDVVYWLFFPYQRGKYVNPILWDTTWYGNHVGDWEHITIRFVNRYPYRVFLSAHAGGETFAFGDKRLLMHQPRPGQTRIEVFSAQGTHALYAYAGAHVYKNISYGFGSIKLTDHTDRGALWDGARGLKVSPWRAPGSYPGEFQWMNFAGRWGNPAQACIDAIDVCRLDDGPTGPATKSSMKPTQFILD